jgi:hypothetical protein
LKTIKFHYINRSPQKEKNFPDKWNLAKSASVLLAELSKYTDERTISFVFEFIKEFINNDNSKIKESVLMAYGSILDSKHELQIKEIIEGSLPTLINLLTDKSFDVRTTVSWVIKKICKYHSDRIINLKNNNKILLDNFIQALIKNLTSNKKVVLNILESINILASKSKSDILQTSILSDYYISLFDNLIQIAYMQDAITNETNIAINAFLCFSSLIEFSPLDVLPLVQNYFSNFIDLLMATKNKNSFQNEEHRLLYQEYICSVLSTYLMDYKKNLNIEQANFIYSEIKEFFIERKTVFENGIGLCSSIALNIGKNFIEILGDYGNFLYHALGLWNEENICKTAIMSVSDIIRALGKDFEPYVDQFLPLIFNIIQNPQCDKSLRSRSLLVISDLFLCCGEKVFPYLETIMVLISNAIEASYQICENVIENIKFIFYLKLG